MKLVTTLSPVLVLAVSPSMLPAFYCRHISSSNDCQRDRLKMKYYKRLLLCLLWDQLRSQDLYFSIDRFRLRCKMSCQAAYKSAVLCKAIQSELNISCCSKPNLLNSLYFSSSSHFSMRLLRIKIKLGYIYQYYTTHLSYSMFLVAQGNLK